jgi:hypothetical protein
VAARILLCTQQQRAQKSSSHCFLTPFSRCRSFSLELYARSQIRSRKLLITPNGVSLWVYYLGIAFGLISITARAGRPIRGHSRCAQQLTEQVTWKIGAIESNGRAQCSRRKSLGAFAASRWRQMQAHKK